MKTLLFTAILTVGFNLAYAETMLQFPTTEAEIVQALTPTPASKRQRKGFGGSPKGLRGIRDDNPKVGALILFDFNSAVIKSGSYALLREFAKALQDGLADARIVIAGHTDNTGTEAYNLDLSERRAQAVKDLLVSGYGITENRITIQAHGEIKPLESNSVESGRMKNRRVEFVRVVN